MYKLYILFLLLLLPAKALAYTPPPAPTDSYLLDQANILSVQDREAIKQKLKDIEKNTSNEIGVLLLTSLDGENIEDVAYSVFNFWKIGKKEHSNGVLLVAAIKDRKMRIETGKGVGGEITDLESKRILEKIKPFFKNQQYAAGINVGIDSISAELDGRITPEPVKETSGGVIGIIFGVILFIGLIWGLFSKKTKSNYSSSYTPQYRRRSSISYPSFSSSSGSNSSSGYSSGSSSSSGYSSGSSWSSSSDSSSSSFGGGDSGGGGASDSW